MSVCAGIWLRVGHGYIGMFAFPDIQVKQTTLGRTESVDHWKWWERVAVVVPRTVKKRKSATGSGGGRKIDAEDRVGLETETEIC